MRRVETKEELRPALEAAMREAGSAFGDSRMFLEQAVLRPRHIEVQILADMDGATVHLFERDCSVQRRHQKVIEIAPAPNISQELRDALYRDAVAFAKSIGYQNAGTVEFLVDTAGERAGEHVFIEMNPRIQVEHTVTEEVTDVDLVASQMRIAAGETLGELGLRQEQIQLRGSALQCRITTEDPAAGFRPDMGKITTYRSPGGAGIRLDGGTINPGAQISPHFDSMLAKLTCRARDFESAVARARRALAEFRIRGVSTNIPFLQAVLDDKDFRAGDLSTSFIDERPGLVTGRESKDRGTRLLNWLTDVTVNHPHGPRPIHGTPTDKLPLVDLLQPAPNGSRQVLDLIGPYEFAQALRARTKVRVGAEVVLGVAEDTQHVVAHGVVVRVGALGESREDVAEEARRLDVLAIVLWVLKVVLGVVKAVAVVRMVCVVAVLAVEAVEKVQNQVPAEKKAVRGSRVQIEGTSIWDLNGNQGSAINYEPSSHNGPVQDPTKKLATFTVSGNAGRYPHQHPNNNFEQPRALFRKVMNEQ
jgi:pyruvate carboxylase